MSSKRITCLVLLLVGQLFLTAQGRAESWQQAASFRVSTENISNPVLSSPNPGSVWRAIFEPSYTIFRQAEANELKAGIALQMIRTSNQSLSQNLDGPSIFFDWLHQNDFGEFGISGKYEEIATRDAGVDGTGQVPIDSTRDSRDVSVNWSRAFSERSTFSANAAYEGVSYIGGNYIDYANQSGGLKFNYAVSEYTTIFLNVTGNKYVPSDGGPNSILTTANIGSDLNMEYMDVHVQFGKSRRNGGNSDVLGAVSMHYIGLRAQLTLNADRTFTPSGLGDFVKVDQLGGAWEYALNERNKVGMDLHWLKNLSITLNNIRTTSGTWLQTDLSPSWQMRTYYHHDSLRDSGTSGASSNTVGLTFAYTYSEI